MKSFQELNEIIDHSHFDEKQHGFPLNPNTVAGAETQLKHLAMNLRTSFGADPQYAKFRSQVFAASELIDQAAARLAQGMSDEEKQMSHKYFGGRSTPMMPAFKTPEPGQSNSRFDRFMGKVTDGIGRFGDKILGMDK